MPGLRHDTVYMPGLRHDTVYMPGLRHDTVHMPDLRHDKTPCMLSCAHAMQGVMCMPSSPPPSPMKQQQQHPFLLSQHHHPHHHQCISGSSLFRYADPTYASHTACLPPHAQVIRLGALAGGGKGTGLSGLGGGRGRDGAQSRNTVARRPAAIP